MKKLLALLSIVAASCSPLPAQNTLAGNLTVQQAVKFTGAASPAQLTSNANDYAPAGFATTAVLRLQSDVPRTITGLAGGAAGRMVWLTNVGTQTISLATESASSVAANRFAFGASGFDLLAGGSLSLWYDTTSSRWRSATNLAAGGGSGTVDQTARDAAAAAQATADSKQAALSNAGTLAKVTESAGLPLWDGAAWPGGGSGGTGTVTSVSVVSANGVSGSVANTSTTPAITLSLGAITPASVAASGAVTGSNLSGTNTGDQTSVTGNAGTATKFATARPINGVLFDGTAAITVPAAAGTLTGATLASGVTASSLTSAAGGTFGTAAFTAATAYDPAGAASAITLAGLGGVPTTRTVNGHALSSNVSVTASDVGLGSVENTALSTWAGSTNLATVGTISSGTWHGASIADTYISSAASWNAKVSFPGFGTTGTTAAVGNDSRLSDARTPTAHNQAWSTITSTPTTLAGYAISDAQPLDSDLTSIAALATTTFGRSLLTQADAAAARTAIGAGTSSFDGAYSSLSGIPSTFTPAAHNQAWSTITTTPTTLSGYGISDAQGLDADLTAVASLNTAGLVARTGAGTAATRTIMGTANQVTVTNGDGVAGNPTLSLPQSIATTSSPTFGKVNATLNDATTGEGFKVSQSGTGDAVLAVGIPGLISYGIGIDNSDSDKLKISNTTANGDIGASPLVTVTSAGNVGIGTDAPGAKLEVAGDASDNSLKAGVIIRDTGTGGRRFAIASRIGYLTISDETVASVRCTMSGNGSVVFSPTSGSLAIDANANIKYNRNGVESFFGGIGTEANVGTTTSHSLALYTQNAARVRVSAGGSVQFITYGAGTLVTDSSGNVTASSDARLKHITGDFTRGLADVVKLAPRTYRWNEKSGMNTDDENVGFIAQEVLEAIPEAVGQYRTSEVEVDGKKIKKREKAELLTLSDRPLIAALVNAVRDLNEKNVALEERVAALEKGKATK